MSSTRFLDQAVAFARLAKLFFSPIKVETWNQFQVAIRRRFPDVRQLSANELTEWMSSDDSERNGVVTLIDCRNANEFAVSHLAGAYHCQSVADVTAVARDKTVRVVIYCAVGYRSSALTQRLQRAGYTKVFNLEGAIFGWANEGRQVCQGSQPLRPARVHPYNQKWGQLLKAELRSR